MKLFSLISVFLFLYGLIFGQVAFPLKSSYNGHYLEDQNDKPFPILGRTSWFVISLSQEDYKMFLGNTIAHGYNAIEMHVLNHDHRGNHPPFNGRGDLPFLKQLNGAAWNGSLNYTSIQDESPDLTTPNESYWEYVDTFLDYCASKGILVFFFPAYVGYVGSDQGWLEELIANGSTKSQAYGAWIAQRYKNQKNLVWMLLGDMGNFTISQRNAEAAMIKGLKSVPGQQSIHYSAEANSGQNSTDQKDFGDQMTLNGTYSWGSVSIPELGRKAYAHVPTLPAFLLEEPYDEEGPDGNHVNPSATQPVRRFQWWGWLSTIGGYISGNGYVWPFVEWKNHLETAGESDMMHLNHFIQQIPWWELVPSGLNRMRKLILTGGGIETNADYVAAAANPAGNHFIAYIPPAHHGSISVDLKGMDKQLTALWFDPSNGEYIHISKRPFENKGIKIFLPPKTNHHGQQDWVLIIQSIVQSTVH